MHAADGRTRLHRRGEARFAPAVLAAVLAGLLIVLGVVVLADSYAFPAPPPPDVAPAAMPALDEAALPPAPPVPASVGPPLSRVPANAELRLTVPALGVDRNALLLGTDDDGALDVPANEQDVGWYSAGSLPGDVGPAVFAGHVNLDGRPGVFSRLSTMRPGQQISVVRPDGTPVHFVVTRVELHAKDAFPTDEVYGPTDAPELRLITCGGSYDQRRGSYRDNVVLFAALA